MIYKLIIAYLLGIIMEINFNLDILSFEVSCVKI